MSSSLNTPYSSSSLNTPCQLSQSNQTESFASTILYSKDKDCDKLTKLIIVQGLYFNPRLVSDFMEYIKEVHYSEIYKSNQTNDIVGSTTLLYSTEKDCDKLTKFVITHDLYLNPHSISAFMEYVRDVHNPAYVSIPLSAIRSEIKRQYKMYQSMLCEMLGHLRCNVALTSEINYSETRLEYLCVTCHWIDDDWILQKRMLAFQLIGDRHSGARIAKCIRNVARRYCISNKIFSISFDNDSNSDVAVHMLKDLFTPKFPSLFDLKCASRVINLIVNDGVAHFKPVITKIKKAVLSVVISGPKRVEFKKMCIAHNLKPKTLKLDYPNEWNYTYSMLVQALEYKVPLTETCNKFNCEDVEGLNDTDWTICEVIVNFLKTFYICASQLSGSYYPTTNMVPIYINEISMLFFEYKDKPFIKDVLPEMKIKFIDCFVPIPLIYLIAAVLDPTMKLSKVEMCIEDLYESLELDSNFQPDLATTKQSLTTLLHEMYEHYEGAYLNSRPSMSSASKRYAGVKFWDKLSSLPRPSTLNELDIYLQVQHVVDEQDYDVLEWWKANARQFPVLASMARDVLMVPVSTVGSKCAFTLEKFQIGEPKGMISDETIDVVECLKDWIHAEQRTQGSLEDGYDSEDNMSEELESDEEEHEEMKEE